MTSSEQKKQKEPTQKEINFALELLNSNKLEKANEEIESKIKKYPESSILFNIFAAILAAKNKLDDAIINYKKALKINPNYAQAYNNLGTALQKLNKMEEAIENYKKAINIKNDFVEAFNNLGCAIYAHNKSKDSIYYFERAIKIKPDYAEAFNNLGDVYQDLGNNKKALDYFQKAVDIKSNYYEVYNKMGVVFSNISKFNESLLSYKKAISLNPNYEKSYNNLGNLLNQLGKYDEAAKEYLKAIKIKPGYSKAYSNLLFNLNYKIDLEPNFYLSIAKDFSSKCRTIKKQFNFKYAFEKNPKKLRIGLVSADFGNHPGGFFSLSTLRELNKKNFDLIAYVTKDRNDKLSNYFKPLFSKWYSIEKKNDEEVVEKIFKDKIHILLDLQGHSADNRLPIFMYKPAPIQVSWLSQGTLGMKEIDYLVGSSYITPQIEEFHFVEKIWRLPEITQCFTAPEFDIKISSLPAIKNNFITFGSINKLAKVNDEVVSLWSKILHSVPNSKLFLRNKDLDNKKISENICERFDQQNIKKDRLILRGGARTRKEILETYNEIDIALDPFPFQGNTSTCEAVWMGVPVLTLKGNRFLFHFGESINSNLKMKEWIAENYQEYIYKAKKFSSNFNNLSTIRSNLRQIAINSPVFDSKRFANYFSKMLWGMWEKYDS